MFVMLRDDFEYVEKTEKQMVIKFFKNRIYEVVYEFENSGWGLDDHTCFVIMNGSGDTMTIGKEAVDIPGKKNINSHKM